MRGRQGSQNQPNQPFCSTSSPFSTRSEFEKNLLGKDGETSLLKHKSYLYSKKFGKKYHVKGLFRPLSTSHLWPFNAVLFLAVGFLGMITIARSADHHVSFISLNFPDPAIMAFLVAQLSSLGSCLHKLVATLFLS